MHISFASYANFEIVTVSVCCFSNALRDEPEREFYDDF